MGIADKLTKKEWLILDFLLDNEDNYYAKTLISEEVNLKKDEVKNALNTLISLNLLDVRQSVFNKLYSINKEEGLYFSLKKIHKDLKK